MLAVLAFTSRHCTAYVYTSSCVNQLLAYTCMWLLGVVRATRLWQYCTEAGRGKKAESMQRWYLNRFEVRMVQVMVSRVVYHYCLAYVCCELCAGKNRGPNEQTGWNCQLCSSPARSSLTFGFPLTILR